MGTSTELVEDDAARTDDSVEDTAAFRRGPIDDRRQRKIETTRAFVRVPERLPFGEVADREPEVIATNLFGLECSANGGLDGSKTEVS
jgi:hypothetical protein